MALRNVLLQTLGQHIGKGRGAVEMGGSIHELSTRYIEAAIDVHACRRDKGRLRRAQKGNG
jgi:hypothetical protein